MSNRSQIGHMGTVDRLIKVAFIFSEWAIYYLLVTAIADCKLYFSDMLLSYFVIRLKPLGRQ